MTEPSMPNPARAASRLRSFRFAFAGLATLSKTQPNARIHAVITLTVIIAGILFKLRGCLKRKPLFFETVARLVQLPAHPPRIR